MTLSLKRTLLFIAIGLIVLVFVFYAGRRSANQDAKVKAAEDKIKEATGKAKYWQNMATIHKSKWKDAEDSIGWMTKDIDSLKKRRMVNVTRMTYLPVVKYKEKQLDSIWHIAFD